jgi:hypothetical protein
LRRPDSDANCDGHTYGYRHSDANSNGDANRDRHPDSNAAATPFG